MPIYRYYCAECLEEQEAILPMGKRDNARIHTCGSPMQRLPTFPSPAQFPVTGRGRVLATLNQEQGAQDFPGGDMHRNRYEQAMAKGLDQTQPVSGRGF